MSFSPFSTGGFASSPFDGMTGYGFSIPQGDPGAIDAAAGAAQRLATAFTLQAGSLRDGSSLAVNGDGGWEGSASAAFATYSAELGRVLSANAHACETAGSALRQLGSALSRAQAATRAALSACETAHSDLVSAQTTASEQGSLADSLRAHASGSVHPAIVDSLARQADEASANAQAANAAATRAQHDLEHAERQGHQAYESYMQEARALASKLQAAAGDLRPAQALAGGAPVPVTQSVGDVTLAATLNMLWSAGFYNGPLIDYVPPGARTPGLVLALLQDQQRTEEEAMSAGGARGPYSLWTSDYFGNSAPTVNSAVAAGLLPPMPSNWGSMSLPARQDFWQENSRFYSGISCEAGACSVVKVVGTGTANASQVLSHLTRDLEWGSLGVCVIGSDGACTAAGRILLGVGTANNVAQASSPGNFLARETVTAATSVVGDGPLAIKSALSGEIERVLPQSTWGRIGLNAFFAGPKAGVTAVSPKIESSLFPPKPLPVPHHHGHR